MIDIIVNICKGGGRKVSYLPVIASVFAIGHSYGALRSWEPSDYVQDGLQLHLDGIRNAGADAAHDSTATVWKDLSGNGRDAALTKGEDSVWTDVGFSFANNAWFATTDKFSLGTSYSMEILTDFKKSEQSGWGTVVSPSVGYAWGGVVWKSEDNNLLHYSDNTIGSVWNNRPGIDKPETATYIIALRDEERACLTSAASHPTTSNTPGKTNVTKDWFEGTKNESANDSEWVIGAKGTTGGDCFIGDIKSVRLYSKLLSNAELAWNRAVDEARFFGAASVTAEPVADAIPDAVIATSVSEAEGCEASGSYVVDAEGYTFTAPPMRKIGEQSYALTGYTHQTWNDELNAWTEAVSHAGEYSVFVAAGDKVKITWQWTATEATLGYETEGYITDGLAIHLDGIRNVASDTSHSSIATVWKDLSGNGRDAMLAGNADGSSKWNKEGNGFYFNKNAVFNTTEEFQLGKTYTVESLLDIAKSDASGNMQVFLTGSKDAPQDCYLYYRENDGAFRFRSQNVTGILWDSEPCSEAPFVNDHTSYVSVLRDGTTDLEKARVVVTTGVSYPDEDKWVTGTMNSESAATVWRFGAATSGGGNNQLKGTIKSIRAYSKLLTEAELAHNRAIDECRFFGNGAPATGAVIIQSSISGLAGREPDGLYFPNGWTFTAPAGTQSVRGIEWKCFGYQLQMWDATTSAWGTQQTVLTTEGDIVGYTPPSGTSFVSVRLTWLWKPVSGIRCASDYTRQDYASGAVALHLDGKEHGSSDTVWSDLSRYGRNAILSSAAWSSNGDGLALDGNGYARTVEKFALGHAFTGEILADVSLELLKDAGFYVFLSPTIGAANSGNCAISYKMTDSDLIWRTDNISGAGWNTSPGIIKQKKVKHLVAARDGRCTALFTEDRYPTNTENVRATDTANVLCGWAYGSKSAVLAPSTWSIGKLDSSFGVIGTIKSVRLYDRLLSENELKWNRSVDSARYFGELATTNVVIAAAKYEYEGIAPGTYEVFGSHTFTASDITDKYGKVRKVRGYSLETWNSDVGKWGAAVEHGGASYVYAAGTSPEKVRLTWKWIGDGMQIILR